MSNKLLVTGDRGALVYYSVKLESSAVRDEGMTLDEIKGFINTNLKPFLGLNQELVGLGYIPVGSNEQDKGNSRDLEATIDFLTDLIGFEISVNSNEPGAGTYTLPQLTFHSISLNLMGLINKKFNLEPFIDLFSVPKETSYPILVVGLPDMGYTYGILGGYTSSDITVTIRVQVINKEYAFNFNDVYLIDEKYFSKLINGTGYGPADEEL